MTPDPTFGAPAPDPIVRQIIEPLYRARVWMKFLAVLGFVVGGLYMLTIVGVVVAWIPILIAVFVWQAASAAEVAYSAGSAADARRSLDRLRLVFITYGLLTALTIGLFVLLLAAGLGLGLLEQAERVMS
ncbi:MAG: DUF5362 family protein [Acidimicrobiia bacterium]